MKAHLLSLAFLMACTGSTWADVTQSTGSRFCYLDEANPYYPNLAFPKLTTPMWIGEKGVEAAILLSIDDMRDPEAYERFLRPLLDRLKQIDGRAPVSIFTCQVVPSAERLQQFLREGVSLEIHTVSHPCPLFRAPAELPTGSDSLALVRGDYVPCIANMAEIPGNRPVAFRMPCCDSLNTNSPRFYSEIFPLRTVSGDFLSASSSVFVLLTPEDPALNQKVVRDPDGTERFRKYIPFRNYAAIIENYPYPYVVDRIAWELPSIVPSDWSAQRLLRPDNPKTVEDWLAALEGVVEKQGLFTLVFHPHNWIKAEQLVELVDRAQSKHAGRIQFLNFREAVERLNKNLLAGHPLRTATGADNGVRLLDVNSDGFLDVIIANQSTQQTRIWQNDSQSWKVLSFPAPIVTESGELTGARFFTLPKTGQAAVYLVNDSGSGIWHFAGDSWKFDTAAFPKLKDGTLPRSQSQAQDTGLRFRDIDGDGADDLLANHETGFRVHLYEEASGWNQESFPLPPEAQLVRDDGKDNGVRFVDLDDDGDQDIVVSNEQGCAVFRFIDRKHGWETIQKGGPGNADRIPLLAMDGRPSGAWFFRGALYLANEHTATNPDLIQKVTFAELLEKD